MDEAQSGTRKWNFKLDLEAVKASTIREPLMKYNTMYEKEQFKQIEEESEISYFENSDDNESDQDVQVPTTGINSES